jgi:hypothetical protein
MRNTQLDSNIQSRQLNAGLTGRYNFSNHALPPLKAF